MNKAKLIAISGLCCAAEFGCMMLATIPALKVIMLILGVIASVAAVIPIMIDPKNLVYTLLIFFAGSILGVFFGMANILFVAPIITFCIPFAITKVSGETMRLTINTRQEQVLEDPFGNGDDRKVVSVQLDGTPRIPKVVRWILYYVLLEIALGLTVLATWLLTPSVFETLLSSKLLWWAIGIMQVIVIPYDYLMSGCLAVTAKILRKVVRPE